MFRLQDIFDWLADQDPQAEVARDTGGRVLTREDLRTRSNRIAHALGAIGLGRGDRVAVLAKNCLDYPALYFGTAKAGVVLVPLNYRLAPGEWTYIVNNAEAKLVIARGADYVEAISGIRDELTTVEHYVALETDAPDGWLAYEEWLKDASDDEPNVEVSPDDDAIQMYTSGTTGLPKGVLLTHKCVTANLVQMMVVTEERPVRMQVVAPFYHAGATMSSLITVINGGSLYVHEDFIPDEVVRVLDEEDIGQTFLVPAMIQALLIFAPDVAKRRYEKLRMISYGAAPISEETLRQAMDVFGCDFSQGFGQTESSAMLTYLSSADHRRALEDKPELLRSAGKAAPGTILKIIDEESRELPAGEVGEIVARGPQLMRGYWKMPDATATTLRDGWLHTGDAGYLDEEGYLFIQDRIKDMIVSGGENVYPAEIEQVLFEHPAIADVAVIGIPDDTWGEAVHAVVQLKPGADANDEDIIAFCRDRLAGYKRPRSIEFIDQIPRNASMKVLKKDLRAPYWKGKDRAVH